MSKQLSFIHFYNEKMLGENKMTQGELIVSLYCLLRKLFHV